MQSYLNSILLDVAHIEMMLSKESDFGFGWGLGAGGGVEKDESLSYLFLPKEVILKSEEGPLTAL